MFEGFLKKYGITIFFVFGFLAIATPFLLTFFPQLIPIAYYGSLFLALAFFPAFVGILFSVFSANKLVSLYSFYHNIRHHSFEFYEGKIPKNPSLYFLSFLTSLYPLGILFRLIDDSVVINEFDSTLLATAYIFEFIAIALSFGLYLLSKSRIMIKFEDGTQFYIGEKLREKVNFGFLGTYVFIFTISYESIISNQSFFIFNLLIIIGLCFGSNFVGFFILQRKRLLGESIALLKSSLFDKEHPPKSLFIFSNTSPIIDSDQDE